MESCPTCGRRYGKRRRCYLCSRPRPLCTVQDCGEPHEARGFCNLHYLRWRRHGSPLIHHPDAKRRYTNKQGYVMILISEGRPSAYTAEHRLIMEARLGRPLSRFEHVHHINGDRVDNRIENLLLLTNADHQKLHDFPQTRSRRVVLTCRNCGKDYEVAAHKTETSHYCSAACRLEVQHEAARTYHARRRAERAMT